MENNLILMANDSSTANGGTVPKVAVDMAGNVKVYVADCCSVADANFTIKTADISNVMTTAVLRIAITHETKPPAITLVE